MFSYIHIKHHDVGSSVQYTDKKNLFDDDIEQDDTVCIKTEYESTVSKGVESLEESIEKDSEEDFDGGNVTSLKTEYDYSVSEEAKSLGKVSIRNEPKETRKHADEENIIYIKTAEKVEVKPEIPLYEKFKIQGEKTFETDPSILMCEDIDRLSSTVPFVAETCKNTYSSDGQVTHQKRG
nr:uncharacterized protein LOC113810083 [Penaeus vannamei]